MDGAPEPSKTEEPGGASPGVDWSWTQSFRSQASLLLFHRDIREASCPYDTLQSVMLSSGQRSGGSRRPQASCWAASWRCPAHRSCRSLPPSDCQGGRGSAFAANFTSTLESVCALNVFLSRFTEFQQRRLNCSYFLEPGQSALPPVCDDFSPVCGCSAASCFLSEEP